MQPILALYCRLMGEHGFCVAGTPVLAAWVLVILAAIIVIAVLALLSRRAETLLEMAGAGAWGAALFIFLVALFNYLFTKM